MTLDEILGVKINKPFNIIGQNWSNPYVVMYKNNIMIFKSLKTGKEIHSWILIKIINGDLDIENIEQY